MKIPKNVKEIMQKIIDAKYEVFIVGGGSRDVILGIPPKDWDLFCSVPRKELLEMFSNAKVIGQKNRQDKIFTIIVGDVEISQYRVDGKRDKSFED